MNVIIEDKQRQELEMTAKSDRTPLVRIKALAILSLAGGKTITEAAMIFKTSRESLYKWVTAYRGEGTTGLRVKPGRGRKTRADAVQIEQYIRQSPRNFGVTQTRWTLAALANVVPSLKGFTIPGVRQAIRRAGFRYKRGQPSVHSPDPAYDKKKGHWSKL